MLSPHCDAVVLALQPREGPVLTAIEANLLSQKAPGAVLIQYWGDVDRAALSAAGVPVWPQGEPRAGHMGVLPSAIGPEPIIRLQAGGLKVGQILARGIEKASPGDLDLVSKSSKHHPYPLGGEVVDRVLLLGMGPTALSALESLAARFQVVVVSSAILRSAGDGNDEAVARARTFRGASSCRCRY